MLLVVLILIPIAYAIPECQRVTTVSDIPCNIISSWTPSGNCGDYNLSIYNSSGVILQNKTWGDYIPFCNVTFNISSPLGTYHYNSTLEDGIIELVGDEAMILSITIFLLAINALVFALPFWVKFSKSEAGNYIVRRLMWIASILLLWFNTTIFRTMAQDNGMNIDNFLLAYWWMFTLGAFASVFIMTYVMVVGATKLMKESKMKIRMGGDGTY